MFETTTGFFTLIPETGNKYVQASMVFIAFFLITKILHLAVRGIFLKSSKKTKTKIDDKLIKKTDFPITFLIILIGLVVSLNTLEGVSVYIENSKKVIISLIWFFIVMSITKIFNIIINTWGEKLASKTKTNIDKDMIPLIRKTFSIVAYIVLFIIILHEWSIDVGPLLASLGIAGLALGFAVQDSLKNIFGGISLILDKTYRIGDIVRLESGESGIIHDIGIRSTKIKNWDNELIVVPNGSLANMKITNVVEPDRSIKTSLVFGVDYKSDPKKVEKIISDVLKKVKTVAKDPVPTVRFDEMGESSLNFKVMYWVDDLSFKWDTREEVIMKMWYAFKKNKINIPFPTRTVINQKK